MQNINIFILTRNSIKASELTSYFAHVGLNVIHYNDIDFDFSHPNVFELIKQKFSNSSQAVNLDTLRHYLIVQEQTELISCKTLAPALLNEFEEAIHFSSIKLVLFQDNQLTTQYFNAQVKGFVFPNLKTQRTDVYNWDDIFVSEHNIKTYQEMKDLGLKNSARDLAMSQMIDALPHIFKFKEKINLNFNPAITEDVVSFDGFLHELCQNNNYLKLAYDNDFFKNILNHILNSGVFVRRASNRSQKNYWLPGLNAGIPLTPKKDEIHEITFMFHDLMHFLFPDLIVTDEISRNYYIIYRMMSEAFTLVLADMLFIHLISKQPENSHYDFSKRKIYPLFEICAFDIALENIDKIENILWANVQLALLADRSEFKKLIESTGHSESLANLSCLDNYQAKYQRFFQEDYRWTANNYNEIVKRHGPNKLWQQDMETFLSIPTTEKFHQDLNIKREFQVKNNNIMDIPFTNIENTEVAHLKTIIKEVFHIMFSQLKKIAFSHTPYNPDMALTQAIRTYMAGQLNIFYQYDTYYNRLFLNQIIRIMQKDSLNFDDLHQAQAIYQVYLKKLMNDNFITSYQYDNYQHIFPMFKPFYVFYDASNHNNNNKHNNTNDSNNINNFTDTLRAIFELPRHE